MNNQKLVIIGGGHAAAQLCASLAEAKFEGSVTMVCAELQLPYHRPPLSKTFVKDAAAQPQLLRPETSYAAAGIDVRIGDPAVKVDRAAKEVQLRSGAVLGYDKLVFATGSRARLLPGLEDRSHALAHGVMSLRTVADAGRLREALAASDSIAVLGGGFIGLELAATARAMGKDVHVIEKAPRLLSRSVSTDVSDWLLHVHRTSGIDIELSTPVDELSFDDAGHLRGLVRFDELLPLDLLLLGIGAVAETALAEDCGLDCRDGILVDEMLRTSDADVHAIGDCCRFPAGPDGLVLIRLESVQNANDQARCVAQSLVGNAVRYHAVPVFWSEQGSVRLQMVGLPLDDSIRVRRPGKSEAEFSMLHYVDGKLAAAEMINSPVDFMTVRKILEKGLTVPPEAAVDTSIPLKSFLT